MSAPGRGEYAEGVLGRLYPTPTQPLTVTPGARFLLLPSRDRARLVVPAGHPAAAARSVQRQLSGQRLRTRTARVLLTLAVRSGAVDRLARRSVVVAGPPGPDSVERAVGAVLGRERVLVTMPVSPPRANRKPVLQVCDDRGAVLAYVKVGHDPLTRALVATEAESLAAVGPLSCVRVPQVLARLEWHDLRLLVLAPLHLPPRRLTGPAARQALLRTVREISGTRGSTPTPWSSAAYGRLLGARLAGCGPAAAPFAAHLAALDDAPVAVTLGATHGDLNPGNLALTADTALVWDWERYERGVPLGFDLLHHDLHRALTVQGDDPRHAAAGLLADAPQQLAGLVVDPAAARLTARLYLLTLAARYLQDRQTEAGAALGDVGGWLLPALDRPHAA